MMGRIKERVLVFFDILRLRRRRRALASREAMMNVPVLRGNMRSVIVVNAPTPIFAQAIFILRDDYFSAASVSREELLCQARKAADMYCGGFRLPGGEKNTAALIVMSAASASALTFLLLCLLGRI